MQPTHLEVNSHLRIPLDEFRFHFARSGGPGGQNVNKVNSKVMLRWAVTESMSVPEPVRRRLMQRCKNRIDKRGVFTLISTRHREQGRNVQDCLDRMREILTDAATVVRQRRPTRRTSGSIAARLKAKVSRGQKKQLRQPPRLDSDG